MAKMTPFRPSLNLDWSSHVDNGMELDLSAQVRGLTHSLMTVVADETDESLWVQVYADGMPVQIPIQTIREMLDAAVGQVHSEAWYEKNKPG